MSNLSNAMFEGVRVVELAQFVFVPAATAVLADLGAEVIKVEMINGDPYRTLKIADGRQTKSANLAMEQNNRGKKSIALDLKTAEGRELFLKLVETADVFLTSLRPAALRRLSLTLDDLRARNPRLIYAHGNGLGFRGDEADRPGYDASCYWARGGFAHVLTPPGQPPIKPRPALGDHTGAMNVAFGMASALFHRERTGKAAVVEISLLATALWVLSSDVTQTIAVGSERARPARFGLDAQKSAYQTSDGRWLQLMFLDPERYWPDLCRRVGRLDLAQDPRFVTADMRNENAEILIEELRAVFRARSFADWRETFRGWDAPWELIQNISELSDDPQVRANEYLFDVEVSDGTDVKLVAGPVAFNGSAVPQKPRRAPTLGEHTDEVLSAIGVSADYLSDCKKRNIAVGSV